MTDLSVIIPAVSIGVAACVTDIRSQRIPNVITFGAAAAGLVFHAMTSGWHGLALAGGGWLVGTALLLPFFLLRGMGGGDVKLVAALGAWLGPYNVFWLVLYTSMAGGVMAIAVGLRHGYLRTAFANLKYLLISWAILGPRPLPELTLEQKGTPRLAYAVPILAGTVATLWLL